jgi:hypothetical protein
MKSAAVLGLAGFVLVLFAIVAAPPAAHAGLNDPQEPGSVLVFPYFRTGTVASVESSSHPKTEIEISVTCPAGATCVEGGQNTGEAVKLRAVWVCPGDAANVCAKVPFNLETTVNGTLYFHPAGTLGELSGATPVPPPACPRGFLVVWVVDDTGRPIKYDGLIGNAVIRETTRPAAAYNAVGIQASVLLPVRAPTDRHLGPGGFNGQLDFNGLEYMPVTGKIFGTVRFPAPSDTSTPPIDDTYLILLTLDALAGRPNQATAVGLDVFKMDESLTLDSVAFVCWTRVLLRDINPDFNSAIMGRKGLVESTSAIQGGRAVTLLGLVETVEYAAAPDIQRAWVYSLNTGGRPVPTTFAP